MGKEEEKVPGWGKVMISIHDLVPRGQFFLCIKEGVSLVNLCHGSLAVLGDSFVANGEARMFVFSGKDVYYVFNPQDIGDKEIRKTILPDGVILDGLVD